MSIFSCSSDVLILIWCIMLEADVVTRNWWQITAWENWDVFIAVKDDFVKCAIEEDIVPSFISLCPSECVKPCSFMGSFKREDNWFWDFMEKCMHLNHTHNWLWYARWITTAMRQHFVFCLKHNFLIMRKKHCNLSNNTEHETILILHSNNHQG